MIFIYKICNTRSVSMKVLNMTYLAPWFKLIKKTIFTYTSIGTGGHVSSPGPPHTPFLKMADMSYSQINWIFHCMLDRV